MSEVFRMEVHMAKYIYPAIFTPENGGGYSVRFPDLEGCFTCGDDLQDALKMANDALSLVLVGLEDEHKFISKPSEIGDLSMRKDEFSSLINVDTASYRVTLNNAKGEDAIK